MCDTGDACGAIATQLANKLKKADRINEKKFRVGKKLGEYELLAVRVLWQAIQCTATKSSREWSCIVPMHA